jgi:hypothetical protein
MIPLTIDALSLSFLLALTMFLFIPRLVPFANPFLRDSRSRLKSGARYS